MALYVSEQDDEKDDSAADAEFDLLDEDGDGLIETASLMPAVLKALRMFDSDLLPGTLSTDVPAPLRMHVAVPMLLGRLDRNHDGMTEKEDFRSFTKYMRMELLSLLGELPPDREEELQEERWLNYWHLFDEQRKGSLDRFQFLRFLTAVSQPEAAYGTAPMHPSFAKEEFQRFACDGRVPMSALRPASELFDGTEFRARWQSWFHPMGQALEEHEKLLDNASGRAVWRALGVGLVAPAAICLLDRRLLDQDGGREMSIRTVTTSILFAFCSVYVSMIPHWKWEEGVHEEWARRSEEELVEQWRDYIGSDTLPPGTKIVRTRVAKP